MAFGYKVPNFNLWGRLWYVKNGGPLPVNRWYDGPYYTRCSVTVASNHIAYAKISVPKYTYGRWYYNTPYIQGDQFQVAGMWDQSWTIMYVQDVGIGFPNEYRIFTAQATSDQDNAGEDQLWVAPGGTGLEPPDGYLPAPVYPPSDVWADPLEVMAHPPPP